MNTATTIACGPCGGTFQGNWDLVECRSCGHQINPITDVELNADEVVRLSPTGVLQAVTFTQGGAS